MGIPKKSVYLVASMIALVALATSTEQTTYTMQIPSNASPQNRANLIVLQSSAEGFNRYNTNGTPPSISGGSAVFLGSNKTNMYQDMVSLSTITAAESLVLQANITANMNRFSGSGEDQFAVFATDDIAQYESDEFGFVLPETGSTWYAYIQSPRVEGFFVWTPIEAAEDGVQHNFMAVYSNDGLYRHVDFYVNGKLVWRPMYPDVSDGSFHMVLTSHKVTDPSIDLSGNIMEVEDAFLSDKPQDRSAYQGFIV